jgi:hypothetical protein
LPQQLLHAIIQGKAETENVTEPKIINQLYFQLEFRYASECGCLGCFKKIMGKLDAVEAGVKIPEADPKRAKRRMVEDQIAMVTLDACIMDENANIDLWRV